MRTVGACGSARGPAPELTTLALAHIDCDAFYAAVEKRDDPSIRHRPVIVGGGQRVVTTACYLARIQGVRSAMPMFKARQLCPQAVIIKPDMAKYRETGMAVREHFRAPDRRRRTTLDRRGLLDLSGVSTGRIPAWSWLGLRSMFRIRRASPSQSGCRTTSCWPRSLPTSTSPTALPCWGGPKPPTSSPTSRSR